MVFQKSKKSKKKKKVKKNALFVKAQETHPSNIRQANSTALMGGGLVI